MRGQTSPQSIMENRFYGNLVVLCRELPALYSKTPDRKQGFIQGSDSRKNCFTAVQELSIYLGGSASLNVFILYFFGYVSYFSAARKVFCPPGWASPAGSMPRRLFCFPPVCCRGAPLGYLPPCSARSHTLSSHSFPGKPTHAFLAFLQFCLHIREGRLGLGQIDADL